MPLEYLAEVRKFLPDQTHSSSRIAGITLHKNFGIDSMVSTRQYRRFFEKEVNMNSEKEITGNVIYLEKVGLLPGSTLHVSLVDVTQPNALKTLATEIYSNVNQNGMDYTLSCELAKLQYGHTYSISASILYEDQVVFTSTEHAPLDLSAEFLWVKDVVVSIVSVSPGA
jgi:uncharacterized lipoprotein YbaY